MLHDPTEAAQQAISLASERMDVHSICIHGDSPNAAVVARAVREALEEKGFIIRPFLSPRAGW